MGQWTEYAVEPILTIETWCKAAQTCLAPTRGRLVPMGLFKKLQENSLYWRYRFITRRFLAVKRWWRELRQPRQMRQRAKVVRPIPRGVSSYDPYGFRRSGGSGVNAVRGISFVVVVAALWTVMTYTTISFGGLPIGIVQIAAALLVAYLYMRFW